MCLASEKGMECVTFDDIPVHPLPTVAVAINLIKIRGRGCFLGSAGQLAELCPESLYSLANSHAVVWQEVACTNIGFSKRIQQIGLCGGQTTRPIAVASLRKVIEMIEQSSDEEFKPPR